MLLPVAVDVGLARRPWANWSLVAVTIAVFYATSTNGSFDEEAGGLLLVDGQSLGFFLHVFGHIDLLHLIGNMWFLWLFGNVICARLGSLPYLVCYFGFGALAAAAHVVMTGGPALGASGAINGVVGMFLVFHPKDYVTVGIWRSARDVPVWILVCIWFAFDAKGLLSGESGVAHAAHLGGLLGGIVVAIVLLKNDLVADAPGPTLLDLNWRR